MENSIYNELLVRGYNVDVGIVEYSFYDNAKNKIKKSCEVDFVCNLSSERIYIQSAFSIPDEAKMDQEKNSLLRIPDSFKKVIITPSIPTHYDNDGILIMNLYDFMMGQEI